MVKKSNYRVINNKIKQIQNTLKKGKIQFLPTQYIELKKLVDETENYSKLHLKRLEKQLKEPINEEKAVLTDNLNTYFTQFSGEPQKLPASYNIDLYKAQKCYHASLLLEGNAPSTKLLGKYIRLCKTAIGVW